MLSFQSQSQAFSAGLSNGVSNTSRADEEVALTLGDISEAGNELSIKHHDPIDMMMFISDDRIKKYFGILPRDPKPAEVKTVRMVKRDSKERTISRAGEENTETPPPPPLPRGNYQV